MSEPTRFDALLESVLVGRAGDGAPPGLRRAIVEAAVTDGRTHRSTTPPAGGRTLRLLAVAVMAGAATAGLLLLGSLGRTDEPPAPTPLPPTHAAVVFPAPSATGSPSPSPSGLAGPVPTAPPWSAACPYMPDLQLATGPDATFEQAAPDRRPAGDLVYLGADGRSMRRLDPGAAAPRVRVIAERLPRAGAILPSPDGAWVVAETIAFEAQCGDPVLVRADGGALRRPFPIASDEAVTDPAWSADGATLYAVHRTLTWGDVRTPEDAGSLWTWSRRTDERRDLGAPCEGCAVLAVFPAPRGDAVAVAYGADRCVVAHAGCAWGVALWGGTGWQVASSPAIVRQAFGQEAVRPLGLASDGSFLAFVAGDRGGVVRVPEAPSGPPTIIGGPCCVADRVVLAADGSVVAAVSAPDEGGGLRLWLFDVASDDWTRTIVLDGRRTALRSDVGAPAMSADLGHVVFTIRRQGLPSTVRALVVPTDGGPERELAGGPMRRPTTGSIAIGWIVGDR